MRSQPTTWGISTGEHSVIGVSGAADIVVSRLAYMIDRGSQCNQAKLLAEALEYARHLQRWARENEPRVVLPEYVDDPLAYRYRGGKPGPMSDG